MNWFARIAVVLTLGVVGTVAYILVDPSCQFGADDCDGPSHSVPILLTVFSSSTKADWIDQIVQKFNAKRREIASGSRIEVRAEHVRSGSSMNDILNGEATPTLWSPGDQSWVTLINETWLQTKPSQLISESCPPTVYAPIGFAMWRPMAEALGWPDTPIGWDTITELAANPEGWGAYGNPQWGQFSFGHPHPGYSNTGLLSMVSFVNGVTEEATPPDSQQIYSAEIEQAMRALEQNTSKYGRGSTPLFDLMVEQGPSYVHAIAASEETTIRYNTNFADELRFPLVFVFPSGGTVWADHPLCILDNADWVTPEQAEAARIFRSFVLAPEQQAVAIDHRLRPTDSEIPLRAPLNLESGTDDRLTYSNANVLRSPDGAVSASIIDLFLLTKRKATVIIVLDTSGSMRGEPIKRTTEATAEFLSRLDPEDEVAVLTFNDDVPVLSEPELVKNVAEDLAEEVRNLTARGSTDLHGAVCQATGLAGQLQDEDRAAGESRLYGIILLSDGEDTVGSFSENQMFENCMPDTAEADGFKVFPIAFGDEANSDLLTRIALRTGGRLFTADPTSISDVYFTISAEQ